MPIHLLPPEVASQIAAGEVIERPASVVKELLENALDADSEQITIIIEGAGKQRIEVADDGCGIRQDELKLAVERHATSKLESAADLLAVKTLGFRGEALASIGSVSRMTITSRPAESTVGGQLRVDGGIVGSLSPVGAPVGTVIRVEDLFYNVPARLKFLKKDTTERRHIDRLVTSYALAYPRVRMHLSQDGRSGFRSSGNGDRREILAGLYGVEIARQMLNVIFEDGWIHITGFISPTSINRANRREISFFVNGRPVRDGALAAAVIRAYHTLLMVGRFPIAVLFLELPAEDVDVNVHPAKAEVRFREPNRVFASLQRAIRRALLANTPVPSLDGQPAWENAPVFSQQPSLDIAGGQWGHPLSPEAEAQEDGLEENPIKEEPLFKTPILRLVGQIAAAYLVAEGPDGLYLIDQHAAHERVLFEKFMSQRREERIPSQSLLHPEAVELPAGDARLLAENLSLLGHLGFQVEPFGKDTYLVRGIPQLLTGMDPAAAIRVLVEDFEEDETPLQAEIESKLIARVCKRAAIKAGKVLSIEEQRSLLQDLEACESPRTCPHGRPTMIHLSVDLLERQFGRKGPR